MRHGYFGRKLSRSANERQQLFKNLVRDIITHGYMTTTIAKAKAVQPLVEQLITHAKKAQASNLIAIRKIITDKRVVNQLLSDAKTRFAGRTSGYTRIIKLGPRLSDATQMVQFSFVDQGQQVEVIAPKKKETKKDSKETPAKQAEKSTKKTKTTETKEEKETKKPRKTVKK